MRSDEDTPTIQNAAVEILLAKVRRSSQTRINISELAAARVMNLDGLLISERNSDVVQGAISSIVSECLQTYHDRCQSIVDQAESEAENALAKSEAEVFRLRKLIWDYLGTSDLDKLTKEALK